MIQLSFFNAFIVVVSWAILECILFQSVLVFCKIFASLYVHSKNSDEQRLQFYILVKQYRAAGKAFIMELVAKSICMQKFSYQHFRFGVLAFNAALICSCVFLWSAHLP
jgi:hypothetical protein